MVAGLPEPTAADRLLAASRSGDLLDFARTLVEAAPPGLDDDALRVLLAETLLRQHPTAPEHVSAVETLLTPVPVPRFLDDGWPANARLRARIVLGYMYRGLERHAEAERAFRQAFNWRPDVWECTDCLADQLTLMGDAAGAAAIRDEHAAVNRQSVESMPLWMPPAAGRGPAALYLDLLERVLCNLIYGDGSHPSYGLTGFDPARRLVGRDLPLQAHSMIGLTRLHHLRWATETVLTDRIPGHVIEAGVWRGGACILMAGVLAAHGVADRRVYVADSFAGLPPPDPANVKDSAGLFDFHLRPELAISSAEVAENFRRYGLLGDNIRFVEGWFSQTLPPLAGETFSILRLDGDLYSSTMDTLVALYDSLSPGGFLICDDFGVVLDARRAIVDFRRQRGIVSPMTAIDGDGIFWRK